MQELMLEKKSESVSVRAGMADVPLHICLAMLEPVRSEGYQDKASVRVGEVAFVVEAP